MPSSGSVFGRRQHNVGINAMLHGHTSYGGICSGASRNHLKFEFGAVITPLGGASLARHGVHDVHRAHYLNLSAAIQDVSGQTLTAIEPGARTGLHLMGVWLTFGCPCLSQWWIFSKPALISEQHPHKARCFLSQMHLNVLAGLLKSLGVSLFLSCTGSFESSCLRA